MKRVFYSILFSFCLFGITQAVDAATIYVNSSTGNDSTGDGTSGAPYKTFHKGYTMASAGDTLNLTGTFTWTDADETGDVANSGYTIGKNLTIQGQLASSTIIQAASSANTAASGVFTVSSGVTATINDVTIRYGYKTGGSNGGGIENQGTLTVNRATIANNYVKQSTSGYGGGISNVGTLTVNNSTVINNFAHSQGGGILNAYTAANSNVLTITNSTIAFNSTAANLATVGGAGVYQRSGTSYITNTTIAYNDATNQNADGSSTGDTSGLDIVSGTTVYLKNSIIVYNEMNGTNVATLSGNNFDITNSGTLYDNGGNIYGKVNTAYSGVSFSATSWYDRYGNSTGDNVFTLYNTATTGSVNLDTSLADNGTAIGTQTFAITSASSIAVNNGVSGTNGSVSVPSVDQRNLSRVSTVDIGAYEYGALADETAPTVANLSPADNATGVGVNDNLIITFNETIVTSTGNIVIYKTSDDSTIETISIGSSQVTASGTTALVINPSVTLDSETEYYVTIATTAVDDSAGNSFAGITASTTWSFTTADVQAPTVSSLSPADNATGVGVNADLVITFNEDIATSTGNIVIYTASADAVFETIDISGALVTASGTTALVINPSEPFDSETEYYVTIATTAVDDTAGNSFAGITASTTWSFTTADVVAPTISSASPSGEQSAGTSAVTISLVTDEAATCKYSTNSGVTFASMTSFSTTGGTSHSTSVVVSDGTSYVYYVKCQDADGNESSQTAISFSVAQAPSGGAFSPPPAPQVVVPPSFNFRGIHSSVTRVYQMAVSEREDFLGASWEPYNELYQSTEKRLYVKFRSPEGGVSEVFEISPSREQSSPYVAPPVEIPQLEGKLIQYKHDPKVYIVEGSVKRWIVDEETFLARGYDWQAIEVIPSDILLPEGSPITLISLPRQEKFSFTRDLRIGMQGEDVQALQVYLNTNGFSLAESGVGSMGQETRYFGELTRRALIRFQTAKGITPAVGYFGPVTRGVVSE